MIPFPKIDPIIVKIGPVSIRWYGVMYLIGFTVSYLLVKYQLKRKKKNINIQDIEIYIQAHLLPFFLFSMVLSDLLWSSLDNQTSKSDLSSDLLRWVSY
jgi:prolipoprotein diacylglyceryltransferase